MNHPNSAQQTSTVRTGGMNDPVSSVNYEIYLVCEFCFVTVISTSPNIGVPQPLNTA